MIESFADELLSLQRKGGVFTKAAGKGDMLFSRFGAIGGAAGLGDYGLRHLKAMATENPYDTPRDSAVSSAVKMGVGGLSAAGVIKLLGMLASRGKKR